RLACRCRSPTATGITLAPGSATHWMNNSESRARHGRGRSRPGSRRSSADPCRPPQCRVDPWSLSSPHACYESANVFQRTALHQPLVFGLVDMAANERLVVRRIADASEVAVEHRLGHAGSYFDLGFQDVRLRGEQQSLLQLLGRHLVSKGMRG